jgi:hypothetical protein
VLDGSMFCTEAFALILVERPGGPRAPLTRLTEIQAALRESHPSPERDEELSREAEAQRILSEGVTRTADSPRQYRRHEQRADPFGAAGAGVAAQAPQSPAEADDATRKSAGLVSQSIRTIGEIEQSPKQIARITTVIEGIALQINLLELNAGGWQKILRRPRQEHRLGCADFGTAARDRPFGACGMTSAGRSRSAIRRRHTRWRFSRRPRRPVCPSTVWPGISTVR